MRPVAEDVSEAGKVPMWCRCGAAQRRRALRTKGTPGHKGGASWNRTSDLSIISSQFGRNTGHVRTAADTEVLVRALSTEPALLWMNLDVLSKFHRQYRTNRKLWTSRVRRRGPQLERAPLGLRRGAEIEACTCGGRSRSVVGAIRTFPAVTASRTTSVIATAAKHRVDVIDYLAQRGRGLDPGLRLLLGT